MTRIEVIERLEKLNNESTLASGYSREVSVRDWENYGKSRTYLSIEQKRENSKQFVKYDCGYYDNKENKYIAGKIDLSKSEVWNLSGSEKIKF